MYIRFLVPAKVLYMWEKHGAFSKQGSDEHIPWTKSDLHEDLHPENTLLAEKRMGRDNGGLARHTAMECQSGVG